MLYETNENRFTLSGTEQSEVASKGENETLHRTLGKLPTLVISFDE